jgi:hypothetical protein
MLPLSVALPRSESDASQAGPARFTGSESVPHSQRFAGRFALAPFASSSAHLAWCAGRRVRVPGEAPGRRPSRPSTESSYLLTTGTAKVGRTGRPAASRPNLRPAPRPFCPPPLDRRSRSRRSSRRGRGRAAAARCHRIPRVRRAAPAGRRRRADPAGAARGVGGGGDRCGAAPMSGALVIIIIIIILIIIMLVY